VTRSVLLALLLGVVLGAGLWVWQGRGPALTASPTGALPTHETPLRVVSGAGPGAFADDAPFLAEVLLSTGVHGMSVGPPGGEVVVFPEAACPEVAHAPPGARRLVLGLCPEILQGQVPPPDLSGSPDVPLTGLPGAAEGITPGPPRTDTGLPLPAVLNTWSSAVIAESPFEPLLRAGDHVVAIRMDDLIVVSFDLVGWLRLRRQGSPTLADVDTDGLHGPKPNDLAPYTGELEDWRRAGGDRWALWLRDQLGPDWPVAPTLPAGAPTVLVLTFDQDFAEPQWIDPLLARVEGAGGTATLLRTDTTRQRNGAEVDAVGRALPPEDLRRWARAGHGLGMHPHVVGLVPRTWAPGSEGPDPRETGLRLQAERLVAEGRPALAARHHFLHWWGYATPLDLQAELGVWVDLTFVGMAPQFALPGFGFGGALPMRFQREDGSFVPVLVQPTVLEDDVLMSDYPYSHGMTLDGVLAALPTVFDEVEAVGAPLVVNIHPTLEIKREARFLDALLAEAQTRGAPIWSAERWAAFTWERLNGQLAPEETGAAVSSP